MIICGAMLGLFAAQNSRRPLEALRNAEHMCDSLMIMLEFESPTVEEMIKRLCREMNVPVFMRNVTDINELIKNTQSDPDGFYEQDLQRICEFFSSLGSADRECELSRTAAAREYFSSRAEQVAPAVERTVRLYRSLGLLGGIFAAVMLI